MSMLQTFLPEALLGLGCLGVFAIMLGENRGRAARRCALGTLVVALVGAWFSLGRSGVLFDGAYRVDAFSQWLKVLLLAGGCVVVLLSDGPSDVEARIRGEYHFLLLVSVFGMVLLVSCVEVVTLVVALEMASFPLYLMVPMRRERTGQRVQMESAVKYMMFGVAANGVMLFGWGYLYGLTGTTSLPLMGARLAGLGASPLVVAGLVMVFAGFYYKLAVFPFHFWSPDVYQGAANETAGLVASLPKVAAMAVLTRVVELGGVHNVQLEMVVAVLAVGSMFFGNLVALVQTDFKRLLGFSGIAHAGYALMGILAGDAEGYTAALYYMSAYAAMVLACFAVIARVSEDGSNVPLTALAGLHRRSPLLALTLLISVFALAGIPPFAGFMGKLALLKAVWGQGHHAVAVLAVISSAIAAYYYLVVIREAFFRTDVAPARLSLDLGTQAACVLLVVVVVGLGVAPGRVLDRISSSLANPGALTAQAVGDGQGPGGGGW